MLNTIFTGIFEASEGITVGKFLLCVLTSLLLGGALAAVYGIGAGHSRSFLTTLALLPAVVCVVIMMVNGNIGAGVAVAGAFSLVRFRSIPGTAREIGAIFIAMGTGLMTGMGYLGFAVLYTGILCGATLLVGRIASVGARANASEQELRITIPEHLDYSGVFDEVMAQYTEKAELRLVKTTNMGSLFKLTYRIVLKADASEKEFLDQLRRRNGNLDIQLGRPETPLPEL